MNDLIERLQLVKDIFDGHAEGDLHPYLEQSDAIGEAIAALREQQEEIKSLSEHVQELDSRLSAPMSEEVRKLVAVLEDYIGDDALETPLYEAIEKAIFMIERLAQERALWKATSDGFSVALRQAEQQRDEALKALADCPRIVEQDEGDEWGFSVDSDDLRGYCKKHVARIRAMGDE